MRNEFFFALYTSWATVWAFVAYSYSGATYKSWRSQDGRFTSIPKEISSFVRWFFLGTYQDVRHGFHRWPERIPERYTSGHLLRFFITLGAFVAGVMGIGTAMVDRQPWANGWAMAIYCAVLFSVIAALGHLSVAWVDCPRKWRLLVIWLVVWFPIAIWIRGML